MNRQWKKYDQLMEKCYQGMAVGETNANDWNDCFDVLIRIIENERESNPDFGKELELLDDETDYRHDVRGWLEDYLDELDIRFLSENFARWPLAAMRPPGILLCWICRKHAERRVLQFAVQE